MNYQIRVKGQLPNNWQDWFPEFDCSTQSDGTLLLQGSLPDQIALLSILYRLSYLNLGLLSFKILADPQQNQEKENKS